MAEVNFGNDGDYSDKSMVIKINSNLSNELGNLCQRTLSMVFKNCNALVPEVGVYTPEDQTILQSAQLLREKAAIAISKQEIHKYVEVMVEMIREGNKYIDEQAPWVLKKTDPQRMGTVLYVIMEILRYSAILYQPLIPESANKMLDLLTVPHEERSFVHLNDSFRIKSGSVIGKPEGIFPRFEIQTEELVNG
jgi:methionyl-tRNA synthetase